jgi:hypothetical protein
MDNKLLGFIFVLILWAYSTKTLAQCNPIIDHSESVIMDTMLWKYKVPTTNINNWTSTSFNDATWLIGKGGFGFGDADDSTIILTSSISVYARKTFTIIDTADLYNMVLNIDYDDGFVAYINGKPIVNIGLNNFGNYNNLATTNHEAQMYQGSNPDYFFFDKNAIDTLLVNGTNVLAIEVHNNSAASTDLTSRAFLSFGIKSSSNNYYPTPNWFSNISLPSPLLSNLPIITINTNGQTILDDPRITVDMNIIYNGVGANNCINDVPLLSSKIAIEYRGSSSQWFPKKPYGFSTLNCAGNADSNESLLGMPAESDWVLIAPYTDKIFMRDVLTFDMARSMGWYAPRTQFVELVINGENLGVHILTEKIKQDKNRVDVAKADSTYAVGDSLTGGYVWKIDKTTGNSGTNFTTPNYNIFYQYQSPAWGKVNNNQNNYCINYLFKLDSVLTASNFTNANVGYRKYMNSFSFMDLFIIAEITNNIDGYRLSTFVHKDRDSKCGKLTFGPVWDYNLAFGNGDYCNGNSANGWQLYAGCGTAYAGAGNYLNRMLQDNWFKNTLACRYLQLRATVLSNDTLLKRIDDYANYLRDAAARDSTKWQTIGNYIWPNGWVASTWQGEVNNTKDYLVKRLYWIDSVMQVGAVNCGIPSNASITISEINYNSNATLDAGDWIELNNYGSTSVNASHWYITDASSLEQYCELPSGTIIPANSRLVIYVDKNKFTTVHPTVTNKYGPLCFSLNKNGGHLIVSDSNFKIVTEAVYNPYLPWPQCANGHGRTLERTTNLANGTIASTWFDGCMGGSPGIAYTTCNEPLTFNEVNYQSSTANDAGDWIELRNNTSNAINISGWIYKDEINANQFLVPSGTSINAGEHLVLYSDFTKFTTQHSVTNKIGPFLFDLVNTGEVLRLYDAAGKIQTSLFYLPNNGWPDSANAKGKTMELINPISNINLAVSWKNSCKNGTPAVINGSNCWPDGLGKVLNNNIVFVTTNNELVITSSSSETVNIFIYNVLGEIIWQQPVSTSIGNTILALPTELHSGVFFIAVKVNGMNTITKYIK